MMRKLMLAAAAGALLLVTAADAKESKKLPRSGDEADCDDAAKEALAALKSAGEKLTASTYKGKAGGAFKDAQNHIRKSEADIRKGCSFAKSSAGEEKK